MPGPVPYVPQPPPKKRRTGLIVLLVVGLSLLVLIGGCSALLFGIAKTAGDLSTPGTAQATPADDEASDEPTAEEPSDEPTEKSAPEFKTVSYSGRGNDVVKFKKPVTDPVLVTTDWSGPQDNNTIYALDSKGHEGDLLVNTIGSYRGTTIVNLYEDDSVAALKVEGSGSWKITLKAISTAKHWDGSGTFSGKSDDVISVKGAFEGLDSLKFKSTRADGNITVYGIGESEELIVNDIGNFSGEYAMPSDVVLLHISSDGRWTMRKS